MNSTRARRLRVVSPGEDYRARAREYIDRFYPTRGWRKIAATIRERERCRINATTLAPRSVLIKGGIEKIGGCQQASGQLPAKTSGGTL
jgi:hypothetical protein